MNKQEVTLYGNDHKQTHEIYAVFASKDKRLLYIGEGLKDRHKHTFSGHSHVRALNTIRKREVPITVEVFGVKGKARAQELEDSLIKSLQPRYNVLAKEFYLNRVVKGTLTPIFRSEMLSYLDETLEIYNGNLKTLITDKCESFRKYFKSLQVEEKEIKEESTKPSSLTYLTMPAGSKYLSDKLPDTLPQNCLFDKALTGCGGTYVALTCDKPYIVAVPTKALVKDKVESDTYRDYNIQGVSEDYPLNSRTFTDVDKIVVTYKSLKSLSEKLDVSRYHLLVDEVHMLSSMASYAREELKWILENFKSFKSYCFMSATVPRNSHLLPELQSLPRVRVQWEQLSTVNFNCYLTDDAQSSILRLLVDHATGKKEGIPYIFYNSVAGICSIIKKWKAQSEYKGTFNVICADKDKNVKALRKVGQSLGSPNIEADFHFITATAFEGVDFYDEDGVTYIVSDKSYATTKYSIETTIPQIVGRLRDSKYNNSVTVLFNKHDVVISMTPREFEEYLDTKEARSKASLTIYNELKEKLKTDPSLVDSVKSQLKGLLADANILIKGSLDDLEDLVLDYQVKEGEFPEAEFYPYTKVVAQQTYDLFHEERFVRGDQKGLGDPLSLGKLKGLAAGLTEEESKLFKLRQPTLKTLCNMYEKSPEDLKDRYEEWYQIIDKVGVEVCKSYSYKKLDIKKLYKAAISIESETVDSQIVNLFKVGQWYSSKYIKSVLESLELDKPKATLLKQWFEIESRNMKHQAGYLIIRKL